MSASKKQIWIVTVSILVMVVSLFIMQQTLAHGSVETPISRIYHCYLEGPENPQSAACQAAVDLGGTQPLYDWNAVSRLAGGNHEEIIPDGQLCSAGNDKYKGLDLARDDWFTQTITADANGNYEFVYYATAPHSTAYFKFYVTKEGYDPTQPLKWSDLEDDPFCTITSVTLENGRYYMTCPLPQNKSGKHVIYNIWQRDDSAEAFYACSDVQFEGNLPPAPQVDIQIDNPNDAKLIWPHITTNIFGQPLTVAEYRIYRDTAPYYMPDLLTLVDTLPEPFPTNPIEWVDNEALGNPTNNYYYYVKTMTVDLLDNEYLSAPSNHVAEFDFNIVPGTP